MKSWKKSACVGLEVTTIVILQVTWMFRVHEACGVCGALCDGCGGCGAGVHHPVSVHW